MRIEAIHNKEGFCTAYCVWSPRDKDGVEDYKGDFVCVDEMWIHDSITGMAPIKHFIKEVTRKYPRVKYGYWERRKYGDRIKMFSTGQLTKE